MDENFDFVVIGSGAGSFAAALVMRSQGKSVVVLEKTEYVGGTTSMSGGVMWIPNNPVMKREGVKDSAEDAELYLSTVIAEHGDSPESGKERRRAFIEQGPKTIDFLTQQGIKFRRPTWPDFYDVPGASAAGRAITADLFDLNELGAWKDKIRPGTMPLPGHVDELMQLPWMKKSWKSKQILAKVMGRALMAKITGKQTVSAGIALQGRMLQAALKAGADVRVNTPVKEILVENGRVVGVIAEQDGKERRFGANLGVLINAGGFSRNQVMRDKYLPGTSVEWTMASPADTGEMIEEAFRLGGARPEKFARVDGQVTLPPAPGPSVTMIQSEMNKPHCITVDRNGIRYMRESGSHCDIGDAMLKRNETDPATPSWAIFDQQFLDNYMLVGTLAGTPKPEAWFTSGFMKRSDTIEGLAREIEVDPATLRATIDRFNDLARKGVDEDFHRGEDSLDTFLGDRWNKISPSLGTIEKGPFLAAHTYPGDMTTFSGVETDASGRVIKADGQPILGLYACGISSTPSLGRHEVGAGGSVGPSLVFGYVAAKHAAGVNA